MLKLKFNCIAFTIQYAFAKLSHTDIKEATAVVSERYTDKAIILKSSIINPIFGYLFESTGALNNLRNFDSSIKITKEPNEEKLSQTTSQNSFIQLLIEMFPSHDASQITSKNIPEKFEDEFINNKAESIKFLANMFVKILKSQGASEIQALRVNSRSKIIENLLYTTLECFFNTKLASLMTNMFFRIFKSQSTSENQNLKVNPRLKAIENLLFTDSECFFDTKLAKLMAIHAYIIDKVDNKEDLEKYLCFIVEKICQNDQIEVYDLNCDIFEEITKVQNIFMCFPYSDLIQPPSNEDIPIFDRKRENEENPFIEDKKFPDCADVLLLNICNCLLYNPNNYRYSVNHLNPDSNLAKFYQKHPGLFTITNEIRMEWSRVVQGLNDFPADDEDEDSNYNLHLIVYKREKRNEIKSGIINMMNVLINIFNIDHRNFWADFEEKCIETKLKELFEIITPKFPNRKAEIKLKSSKFSEFGSKDRIDFTGIFHLIFNQPNGSVITLEIEHMSFHAEMNLIKYDCTNLKGKNAVVNPDILPNVQPVTFFKNYIKILLDKKRIYQENIDIKEKIFFSGFMLTNEQKKEKLKIIFDYIIMKRSQGMDIDSIFNTTDRLKETIGIILNSINFEDEGTSQIFKPFLLYTKDLTDSEILECWLDSLNIPDSDIYKLWSELIPNLKSRNFVFDLFELSLDSIENFFEILKNCNELKSLKLVGINNKIKTSVLNQLQTLTNLTGLDLSGNELGLLDSDLLPETLMNLTNLKSLNLSDNELCSKEIQTLSKALENLISLVDLDMSSNGLCKDEIEHISKAIAEMSSLSTLNLSENELDEYCAVHLSKALEKSSNLTKLDISDNNFGSDDIQLVLKSLQNLKNFTDLDISNNDLECEGAELISNSLKALINLKVLNISDNDIGFKGARYISIALKDMKNLQVLDLSKNALGEMGALDIASAFESLKELTKLDLSSNKLGPKGIKYISVRLEELAELKSLDLSANLIECEGARYLSSSLIKLQKITNLEISYNKLTDKGVIAISEAVKNLKQLSAINLSNNFIAKEGFEHIWNSLQDLNNLATIDLSYNQLDSMSIQNIIKGLKSMNKLMDLKLSGNKIGSAEMNGILEILKEMKVQVNVDLFFNDSEE